MKILERYNDYMLDLLLESVKNDTSMLYISDELRNRLININHPISKKILDESDKNLSYSDERDKYLITLLDVNKKQDSNGNEILDSISFSQSSKIVQQIAKSQSIDIERGKELARPNRIVINMLTKNYGFGIEDRIKSETTLGRVVKKLFGDEFKDHEIGEFVEKYKSVNVKGEENFELVDGDDIIYWYNQERYTEGQGPMNDSCMRYERCGEYLNFYSKNDGKVSLLILKDPDDDEKIIGRAIIWKLDGNDEINDNKLGETRYFMDRIYYTREIVKEQFINYATEHKWIYKKYQNMDADAGFIDTIDNSIKTTITIRNILDNDTYPYMDTMKFYDGKTISNDQTNIDRSNGKKLEDTYGDSYNLGVYIAYYDEYIDVENDDNYYYCEWIDDYRYYEDRYYSDYYDVDIANDYAEKNMVDCDDWCSDEYDNYRLPHDCYYSNYYNAYIAEDFVSELIPCFYNDDTTDKYRLEKDAVLVEDGKYATKEYASENFKYNKLDEEWLKNGVWSEYYDTNINKDSAVLVINKETGEKDWRKNDDETWYYDEKSYKYYSK